MGDIRRLSLFVPTDDVCFLGNMCVLVATGGPRSAVIIECGCSHLHIFLCNNSRTYLFYLYTKSIAFYCSKCKMHEL